MRVTCKNDEYLAPAGAALHHAGMSMLAGLAFSVLVLVNGEGDLMQRQPASALPDPCGKASVSGLVGQVLPPPDVLSDIEVPGPVRVIRPGQRITMDHVPERLNIVVDDHDVVVELRCG